MEKYHQHLHLIHHIHYKKFLRNKYNDLVIANTLRQVALSMITLFITIFLLRLGYTLFTVAVLELFMLIATPLVHFIVIRHIGRWGVKHTLIISYITSTLFYVILYNAEPLRNIFTDWIFLALAGIFNVMAMASFWTAHHYFFLRTTKRKESGAKEGIMIAVPVMFGIVGPLLGGFLITRFNFELTFFIVSMLLAIASVTLFFSKRIKVKPAHIKMRKVIDKKHISKNLIYFLQGVGFAALSFMWPIFMFLSSITLVGIGLVHVFAATAHSIFCYQAGKLSDKYGTRKIAQFGTLAHAITYFGRILITTVIGASLWQTLGGIFGGLNYVPLETSFYKNSHRDIANAILNRETYMHFGRILLLLVFLILLANYSALAALKISIIIAGVATIVLSFVISKDKTIMD